ncbi:MAG TPA: hypothetical protein VFW07_25520 [Parafilimonas sp.]|nr:hypothetical protein [Parafilimonas sp.]
MKHLFTVAAIAAFLFITTTSNANIYRVGYSGPKKNNVDFTDLNDAVNACSTNPNKPDTIFLFPGTWSADYDRKIVTIGYGYYVDTATLGTGANNGLQNIIGNLSVTIQLGEAVQGCVFEGVDGLKLQCYYYPTDNITIKRCKCYIDFRNTVQSNWKILQSEINLQASFGAQLDQMLISNCIITDFVTDLSTSQSATIVNNIFTGNWYDPSFVFKNNVFLLDYDGELTSTSTYEYNVFVGKIAGGINGSHNKINQNKDAIFTGYSSQKKLSNDARWQLKKPNSPAIGSGENGIDCGIYAAGSLYPYRLSGIPAVPSFYLLEAPSSTTGTGPVYQITFSVKSNN